MPTITTTAGNAQLMGAINTLVADEEDNVALPMTAINQWIAQLSQQSSKTIVGVGNAIIKSIAAGNVSSSNDVDAVGTQLLQPLYDWQSQNDLVLTQLAAGVGLTQPGEPLESALLNQTAQAPELAYSASLLLALREAMSHFGGLIEVLREIRDRMPPLAASVPGEAPQTGDVISDPTVGSEYSWVEPTIGD